MKSDSKLIKFGNFIGDMLVLQVLAILYTFRGAILFGIFPSFVSSVQCMISKIYNKEPDDMRYEFKLTYKENFKIANLVCWPLFLFLCLVIWEYRLNREAIANKTLAILLGIIILLVLIILSHTPITILRFDLAFKGYFKQAFLIALASPIETISIILSLVLIELIFSKWLFIPMLFFAPIISLPFAWFSHHSLEKIIKKRNNMED